MRNRRRRPRVFAPVAIIVFALFAASYAAGFLGFVDTIARTGDAPPGDGSYDAIVVLTGGGGRLEKGLELLVNGNASRLFVSGVDPGVDAAALLHNHTSAAPFLDCCIVLGHDASDTLGNAIESARWMAAEGFESMYLVTANYHMPRSLLEFRTAMPHAAVAPEVVHPANVHLEQWWQWPGTARLLVVEYTKYLAARLRASWAR